MNWAGRTIVVAGNGPSLADIAPGQVLADDVIIRTNNFFFEPEYFVGPRVDMAFMGGDPRVAPFMFETLWQCSAQYDLRGWSACNAKVAAAGQRRFAALYRPANARFGVRSGALEREITALVRAHDRRPLTGTCAAMMAHRMGAANIVLAGIDLHGGPRRYAFEPGRHMRDLLGDDLACRGSDTRLHSVDLDIAIFSALIAHGGARLTCTSAASPLAALMEVTRQRRGAPVQRAPRHPPPDWPGHAGLYPIAALKGLRRLARWRRRIQACGMA